MTPDAIVIGGGFAGLSAATALAEGGARVLVLEARRTLGGRATAFTDPKTGERVDNGQHVLLGCYRETFRFLRRIGSLDRVRAQAQLTLDVVDRAGRPSRLACPALPSPFNLLGGLLTWRALGWRDRWSACGMRGALSGRADGAARDETVRQWLVRHGQSDRVIEVLWEPLAIAALNQTIDVAAAAPFGRVLAEMLGRDPGAAALVLPRVPLDEVYARPAQAFLEARGSVVRTSAPASIVARGGGDARGTPQVEVGDQRLHAPVIVCAVPWFALSRTFPGRPAPMADTLDAADRTTASPIVTVNLWFDRPVAEYACVGLPGRAVQWVFDKSRVFDAPASHLSLVASAADALVDLGNDDIIARALVDLHAAVPRTRTAVVTRGLVVRERQATFSVASGQPRRPDAETAWRGLFLAGDWIQTGLPATIEGAVRSGHTAAAKAARPGPP